MHRPRKKSTRAELNVSRDLKRVDRIIELWRLGPLADTTIPSDVASRDTTGAAMSITNEGFLAVGVRNDDDFGSASGSTYLFSTETPRPVPVAPFGLMVLGAAGLLGLRRRYASVPFRVQGRSEGVYWPSLRPDQGKPSRHWAPKIHMALATSRRMCESGLSLFAGPEHCERIQDQDGGARPPV